MEKLVLERTNLDCIHLHLEGMFWKAYQRSAYLFVSHVASFKIKKRKVKATSTETVSLGFPKSSLLHHFKQEQIEQIDEKHLKICGYNLDEQKYNSWFDSIPLTIDNKNAKKEQENISQIEITNEQRVIELLKTFRLENSSPMECMMFVAKTKEILHGDLY